MPTTPGLCARKSNLKWRGAGTKVWERWPMISTKPPLARVGSEAENDPAQEGCRINPKKQSATPIVSFRPNQIWHIGRDIHNRDRRLFSKAKSRLPHSIVWIGESTTYVHIPCILDISLHHYSATEFGST